MLSNIAQAYDRFCVARFKPASEAQIVDLEQMLAVRLSNDFREYLRIYNGGRFNMPRFLIPDPKYPRDCLRTLFGIEGPSDFTNLSSSNNLSFFDNNHPAILLPIGVTISNNLLLLRTEDGEGKGNIAVKLAFRDDYCFVAESIGSFFDLLQENPDA